MRQQMSHITSAVTPKSKTFSLDNYINYQQLNQKIICLPLEFDYVPVEILSKQFTKLNNPHAYRIHYLGPRYKNTLEMHKKNAYSEKSPYVYNPLVHGECFSLDDQKHFFRKKRTQKPKKQLNCSQEQEKTHNSNVKEQLLRQVSQFEESPQKVIEKYKIDMRKIAHSYILQEKLKNTQYFKTSVYYRAFQGMNPTLDLSGEIIFNSCFEGGNLDCVIKVTERQFDLFLRIDSNTRGHLLWFYFSVKNQQNTGKVTMNICNFSKSKNLYKDGLKPYVFSTKKHKLEGKGWQQSGKNLGLEKREFRYQILEGKFNSNSANTLILQYDFEHQNDQVFFAYCVPYTYSQLINDIQNLPEKYIEKKILGKSLLGTDIPILHISENRHQTQKSQQKKQESESTTSNLNSDQQNGNTFVQNQKKRVIFATGRIHPSESNSSYLIMGFIKWLCSQRKQAVQLRKIARFIIVPMVNPDGVIIGNSRTSASGKDLNRQYIDPDGTLHPEICLIKQIAKKIHEKEQITLFLDFHGHSRKKNTFFYGPVYGISEPRYYKCRILPKLIEKISNPFRYHSCTFSLIEEKKKTARASMFQNLGIDYTYTVESSIGYFYDSEQLRVFEFTQMEWSKMGAAIAQGSAEFITGIESYEQFLNEKRKQRLKKKRTVKNLAFKHDYLEDQAFPQNENVEDFLKINYQENILREQKSVEKSKKSNPFFDILEQIRTSSSKKSNQKSLSHSNQKNNNGRYFDIKDLDAQEDSDSHDERQDMDVKKLKQLTNIVKQQIKSFNSVENYDKNLKLQYFNDKNKKQLSKTKKNKKTKIVDEFQLLSEKEQKVFHRTTKTGQAKRNKIVQKNQIQPDDHDNLNANKKTLPEESGQAFNEQAIINKFETTLSKLNEKRQAYTSAAKRDKSNVDILDKKEKTVINYFGEYRLIIDEGKEENMRRKQKYDILRRLQNRRQSPSKKRAVYSSQRNYFEHCNSLPNQHSTLCYKKKIIQQHQIIHGPTQFTFSIPFSETNDASKPNILKPKLKVHLRQKPQSVQNFTSTNNKQRNSSVNLKQKSDKIIQELFQSHKQHQRERKGPPNYIIQNGAISVFTRMSIGSQKTTSRELNRSTKLDFDDIKNKGLSNTLKVYQM